MGGAVVGAIAAAAGAAAQATILGAASGAILTSALVAGASSLVLGGLARALAPDPPSLDSNQIKSRGIVRQIRQPITTRKVVYGEVRVSGPIVRMEQTSNNEFLHVVIALADHEVEEIGEVWFNDYPVTDDMLDGSNVVNTGRYDGLVRINKHLGTAAQTADSDLVAETSATSTDRARGVAYIYVRLKFDRDKFPTGVPNISAWVKGRKMTDTRTSTEKWTPNVGLMAHDYLSNDRFGYGASSDELDDTFTNAAANTCEEIEDTTSRDETVDTVDFANDLIEFDVDKLFLQTGDRVRVLTTGTAPGGLATATDYYVIPFQRKQSDDTNPRIKLATNLDNAIAGAEITITDAGTGTHTIRKTGEPRYFGGGVLDTAVEPQANIEDIISGMAGRAVYSSGSWKLLAGAFASPTLTFDESHIIGAISVQTRLSRRERFNTVKGTYISPINDGQPSDYPVVTNSTFKTNDNGRELIRDVDLPFTQRPHTAQRIAKIELEKSRQEITFNADFNLHAMQLRAGDTVNIDNTRFGWSSKVFEVVEWGLEMRDGFPVVNMTLRETASTVYDWSNGEETSVDPAPNTTLPNPFDVDPPTGLAVTPVEITTASGDITFKFTLTWTAPSDIFVTNGGYYEVQFKRTSDTDWTRNFRAEDEDTAIDIPQVKPAVNYDTRIRAVNSLGVRSAYQSLFGFTIDSPSGATIALDYGQITGTVIDTTDFGSITDSVDDTLDFGSIV